jgi:hypothetical protein
MTSMPFFSFPLPKFHVMLPLHAMVMEAAQMMEIANVTTVSIQKIAQVNFF